MPRRPLDEFPEEMTVKDVAEWRGVSAARIYSLEREGALDFAICKPRLGKITFSRERLRQWLNGELLGLTGRKLVRVL